METIIETNKTNLAGIHFKKMDKIINWSELTRDEQLKILNALSSNYALFYKFLKDE